MVDLSEMYSKDKIKIFGYFLIKTWYESLLERQPNNI